MISTGGFYSDEVGYVAKSCMKCPNGSFVPPDKAPGKSSADCKACPLGKDRTIPLNRLNLRLIHRSSK